jgi:hypothetical protein
MEELIMTQKEKHAGGRPKQGITKKVSLTLTADEWAELESSGKTPAAFLKDKMHNKPETVMPALTIPITQPYSIPDYHYRYAMGQWRMAVTEYASKYDHLVFEEVQKSLFKILFPNQSDIAITKIKIQYECPFTGKRFGSIDALIKNAIPFLLESTKHVIQQRIDNKRIREAESSPKYFDQIR